MFVCSKALMRPFPNQDWIVSSQDLICFLPGFEPYAVRKSALGAQITVSTSYCECPGSSFGSRPANLSGRLHDWKQERASPMVARQQL